MNQNQTDKLDFVVGFNIKMDHTLSWIELLQLLEGGTGQLAVVLSQVKQRQMTQTLQTLLIDSQE